MVPAGQKSQPDAPLPLYLPALQAWQELEQLPLENVPAPQLLQEELPPELHCPAGQQLQEDHPDPE